MIPKSIVCLLAFLLCLTNCSEFRDKTLQQSTQFTLDIGKMEDQIDLMQLPGIADNQKIRIISHKGFYFISNGNSFKVMEFSSYGDLLSLYYNEVKNPKPVLLDTDVESGQISNRKAYKYPFREVGEIGITSGGTLLIEDNVAAENQEFDSLLNAMLRKIVLRFNNTGEYLDYLGQEGVGGTPFPYIEKMIVNLHDEIIVIARGLTKWIAFWYTDAGEHLFTVQIDSDDLPLPEAGLNPTLDTIFPGVDTRELFVKIDYYKDGNSADGPDQGNSEFYKSSVYWIDMQSGDIKGSVDLPKTFFRGLGNQSSNRNKDERIYYFLGLSKNSLMFFLSPLSEDTYQMIILDKAGKVFERSEIILDDEATLSSEFYVSAEGLLTALIGRELDAAVLTWRTDRLVEGVSK